MTSPIDLVVSKLAAVGCAPSPTGTNEYESLCPVHQGKRKNLSVGVGDDGRVLFHCHHVDASGQVGCTADAIVGVLGLRLQDLWPKSNGPTITQKSSGRNAWKTLDAAMDAVASHIKPKPITTDSWTYHDAHGNVMMVVGRFNVGDREKTYRPFHRLADGSW